MTSATALANGTSGSDGTSWRDPILAEFSREIAAVSRLTVVLDPDELLAEPGIVEGIRDRGFEVITFEDHVSFRYVYERQFRRHWDEGCATKLAVVLRSARTMLESLPNDLICEAQRERRILSFSLVDLFPYFQPQPVLELDRGDLDALYDAQTSNPPDRQLGLNGTQDYLLRHVFEVAPEAVREPSDLLRALLRRHYGGRSLPKRLDDRLILLLRNSGRWDGWPLERIVPGRRDFFQFLQERWPHFVKHKLVGGADSDGCGAEAGVTPEFAVPGPVEIPFDHDDVRVYVDNLFVEGLLEPAVGIARERVDGTWMSVGVVGSPAVDGRERLDRLLDVLDEKVPSEDARHHDWLDFAKSWSEAIALQMLLEVGDGHGSAYAALQARVDAAFQAWLERHYSALASLPALPKPAMLHGIPRFLAHGIEDARRALLVVDGLSLDQWVVVRDAIESRWSMEEDAIFAWIPTLTSVSRQSIFAASPPFYFSSTIGSTHKEASHWRRFWQDRGFSKAECAYVRQKDREDDQGFLSRVREEAERPDCRVLGAVIGTVDRMIHGAVTGTDGLHANVRHWGRRSSLDRLMSMLVENGFEIFLTADHGSVEASGMGKPNVGETAEQRGERVHVFGDETIRNSVAEAYPSAVSWPTTGLPDDYLALIAPPRRAFMNEGKRAVTHGGSCIEEVIVPFVCIERTG